MSQSDGKSSFRVNVYLKTISRAGNGNASLVSLKIRHGKCFLIFSLENGVLNWHFFEDHTNTLCQQHQFQTIQGSLSVSVSEQIGYRDLLKIEMLSKTTEQKGKYIGYRDPHPCWDTEIPVYSLPICLSYLFENLIFCRFRFSRPTIGETFWTRTWLTSWVRFWATSTSVTESRAWWDTRPKYHIFTHLVICSYLFYLWK